MPGKEVGRTGEDESVMTKEALLHSFSDPSLVEVMVLSGVGPRA